MPNVVRRPVRLRLYSTHGDGDSRSSSSQRAFILECPCECFLHFTRLPGALFRIVLATHPFLILTGHPGHNSPALLHLG